MVRATDDSLVVTWFPDRDGTVVLQLAPKAVGSEGDTLTIASHSGIVASKAIWTTYPEVQHIRVDVLVDFTDAAGATKKEVAVSTTVDRATAEKFVYDGLSSRAYSDNKLWVCGADEYRVHAAVYLALKDKGCLALFGVSKP